MIIEQLKESETSTAIREYLKANGAKLGSELSQDENKNEDEDCWIFCG